MDADARHWFKTLGPVAAFPRRLPAFLESLLPVEDSRGLLAAAHLLSQLVYWHKRGANGEWTYKRDVDMMAETGLTRHELLRAKHLLVKTHFVNITHRGLPRTTWYRVDMINLLNAAKRFTDE
ncbi:MAG: hypothetical protein FJ278_01750 [Planctomycetes bacterium]|nr:hypothetical protein [Planctomycetota bacterium]